MSARAVVAVLLAFAACSCADLGGSQIGLGMRGAVTFDTVEDSQVGNYHALGGADGSGQQVLLAADQINIRGRALGGEVTLGTAALKVVGGVEWDHERNVDFRSNLFGLRFQFNVEKGPAGPYVDVLGRRVADRDLQHTLFDGFEIGAGGLVALGRGLFIEVRTAWTYIDGDALRAGVDSIGKLRFGLGLRYEL